MTVNAPTEPFVVNDSRLVFRAEDHSYWLGERRLPSVTAVLKDAGLADFSAPWFTDAILARGSAIHQAIALDIEGVLDEDGLDETLLPYLAGWRRFLEESVFEVERWEIPVCDPILGYAGTLDGILRTSSGTRKTLVDVKRGFYPSAGPQTAAYQRLAGRFYDTAVSIDRAVIELPGDGTYRFHRLTDPNDNLVFLSALRVHHWKAVHHGGR